MSEITNNIEFEVDTPTYLAENTSATWEDLVKNCVLPAFKTNVSSQCAYKDFINGSTTCPAVSIPWHNDTVDGDLFIYFNKDKTATVGTNTDYPHLSICGSELKTFMVKQYRNGGAYSGGTMTNYKPSQYNFGVRILIYTDFQAIGIREDMSFVAQEMNTPYITTSYKRGDQTLYGGFYTEMSGSTNNYYGLLKQYVSNSGSLEDITFVPQQSQKIQGGAGLAVPLDDGKTSNEYFYIMSGNYSSCRGAWSDSDQGRALLISGDYADNLFYKNAFTIKGQSFDAFILTNNSATNSYPYPMVLRKHID